jgi:ADP-L-glycero-D-manno-heptose 6-epimerase
MPLFVVTGANGFIGTNLVAKLLSLPPEYFGFEAVRVPRFSNFDHDECGSHSYIIAADRAASMTRATGRRFLGSARYTYVDHEELIAYLEAQDQKPDAILHNGACSSTTEADPQLFSRLNLNYSQLLWNYCVKHQVPLLYASSAATYGDGLLGFSDKKEDCEKYTPLNLYGKSKLDFDIWTLKQKKTPPSWFGLRYFNVFGQFESHKGSQASMVYHGYHQAVQTGTIRLFESNSLQYKAGEQKRDFISIDDLVQVSMDLLRLVFARKNSPNVLFLPENGLFINIGRGVAESWNTLAQEIFFALSLPQSIEYIPMHANILKQYQNYTCADLSTLCSLGVNHEFLSFKAGVERYVQQHLMRGQ